MPKLPRKLVVGNWKMNTTVSEGSLLLNRIHKELSEFSYSEIVLCPPYTHLYALNNELKKIKSPPKFLLGAQNISEHEQGAFTGEVSATIVSQFVDYVIIGHSERRKYAYETDTVEAKKIAIALRHGIKPILCVGESEQDRQLGKAKQVILDRLNTDLSQISKNELDKLVIAYEPTWAIGNGNFAKPAQVEEIVMLIRNVLAQIFGRINSMNTRILYGGSVDSTNAQSYLKLNGIDGFLVGSASLNYKNFSAIVKTTQPKTGISL